MTNKICGFSAVIVPEDGGYSAWAPELDIASQGDSIEEALANLKEALELHLECLTPKERKEILDRHRGQIMTELKVEVSA